MTHPKCSLCNENGNCMVIMGQWIFHNDCYAIVIERMSDFVNILFLPEDEFQEWIEDNSQ